MITTITGSNDYLCKQELASRVSDFIKTYDDMAVEHVDGEEDNIDRLREAIHSMPFLSARKLVVLRNPGKQKQFSEQIAKIIDGVPETTDVIIYEAKLDKRTAYYKALKKETDFKEYAILDAAALASWAVTYVTEKAGTLMQTDAMHLVNRIGADQLLVKSELDKLYIYNAHITRQTIELLTEPTPQSTIFELLDAAFAGKMQRTFALYAEQRALKVEPQAIIAMLAWQLHILVLVKTAGTRSVEDIAKQTKLNPFVIRKSQSLVRKLDMQRLKQFIADLLQLDLQLKTSAIDADQALKNYLLKLL